MCVEVRSQLNADPRCVAEARQLTDRTLSDWGLRDLREAATLLVSELTTNAILHARTPVTVTISNGSTEIRIHVCDNNPRPPQMRHFSAESATGRGIRLLEALATTWGVERNASGKCVWFTLALDHPPLFHEWEFDFDSVQPL